MEQLPLWFGWCSSLLHSCMFFLLNGMFFPSSFRLRLENYCCFPQKYWKASAFMKTATMTLQPARNWLEVDQCLPTFGQLCGFSCLFWRDKLPCFICAMALQCIDYYMRIHAETWVCLYVHYWTVGFGDSVKVSLIVRMSEPTCATFKQISVLLAIAFVAKWPLC